MSKPSNPDPRSTSGLVRWWRQFCIDNNVTYEDGFASEMRFSPGFDGVLFRFFALNRPVCIEYHWDTEEAFGSFIACLPPLERELIERINKLKKAVKRE